MAADKARISIPLQSESTSVKTTQVAAYAHSHHLHSLGCGNAIVCNSLFAIPFIFSVTLYPLQHLSQIKSDKVR